MEDGPLKTIRQAIQNLGKYQIEIDSFSIHPEGLNQILNEKDSLYLVDMGWWSGTGAPERINKVCGIPFTQSTLKR